jgi:COP9 signalosome complex subunit 6
LDHSILRSISATLARINILSPPDAEAFTLESQQEASDVQLVDLLASLTNSISVAKDFGKKSQIVEDARQQRRKGGIGGGMGGGMGSGLSGGSGEYGANPFSSQYLDTVMNSGGGGGMGRQLPVDQWS